MLGTCNGIILRNTETLISSILYVILVFILRHLVITLYFILFAVFLLTDFIIYLQ